MDNFFILWITFCFLEFSTFFPQASPEFSTGYQHQAVFITTKLASNMLGLASPIYREMFLVFSPFGRGGVYGGKKGKKIKNCSSARRRKGEKFFRSVAGAVFTLSGVSLRSIIPSKEKCPRNSSPLYLAIIYFLFLFCWSLASLLSFCVFFLCIFSRPPRLSARFSRLSAIKRKPP